MTKTGNVAISGKVLAATTAIMLMFSSIPAANASDEAEKTGEKPVTTPVHDENQEETGFQEKPENRVESVEEFIEFGEAWFNEKEHRYRIESYVLSLDEIPRFKTAFNYAFNPDDYYDIVFDLIDEGIILSKPVLFHSDYVLSSNIYEVFNIYNILLHDEIRGRKVDLESICRTQESRDAYRTVLGSVKEFVKKKKINIADIHNIDNVLCDAVNAANGNINVMAYACIGRLLLEYDISDRLTKTYRQKVAKILNVSESNSMAAVAGAIHRSRENGLEFDLDSDDIVEVLLAAYQKNESEYDEIEKYIYAYDKALSKKITKEYHKRYKVN